MGEPAARRNADGSILGLTEINAAGLAGWLSAKRD